MVPRQKRPACLLDFQTFDMTVRKAFEQRRKTLRNALNTVASPSCFERAGVQPEARAATLEVRDFVHLANAIHDSTWQQPVESSE
jgi:16S rRNA (adenine1518-N6/adenine1519-N6)-dimethyltransferase